MKRCRHRVVGWFDSSGLALDVHDISRGLRCTLSCHDCGHVFPLGPAKLDGEHAAAVAIEIRAAEMADAGGTGDNLTARHGWDMAPGSLTTIDSATELAGWLAREIFVARSTP